MNMMSNIERTPQTGLDLREQLAALRGLKAAVTPAAWRFWGEALPAGPERVVVAVAKVEFDVAGEPVAFGVRRSEMLRTIKRYGDISSNSAQLIAIEPERSMMFAASGDKLWSSVQLLDGAEKTQ